MFEFMKKNNGKKKEKVMAKLIIFNAGDPEFKFAECSACGHEMENYMWLAECPKCGAKICKVVTAEQVDRGEVALCDCEAAR